MSKVLTIIFGAGASHDCHSNYHAIPRHPTRAPLTDNLFVYPPSGVVEGDMRHEILGRFPGAAHVADLFKRERELDPKLSLEQFLKKRIQTNNEADIKNIREVPFYLREFIGMLGRQIKDKFHTTDYGAFIEVLARNDNPFDTIILMTLNYDLLLDYALDAKIQMRCLDHIDNYINHKAAGKTWHYLKCHGSVNWELSVDLSHRYGVSSGSDEKTCLNRLVELDPNKEFFHLKDAIKISDKYSFFSQNEPIRFPLMVLPVGNDKFFICPNSHENKIREVLPQSDECWIIGNSFQDDDLKIFLMEHAKKISRVGIVSLSENNGQDKAFTGLKDRVMRVFRSACTSEYWYGFHFFTNTLYQKGVAEAAWSG